MTPQCFFQLLTEGGTYLQLPTQPNKIVHYSKWRSPKARGMKPQFLSKKLKFFSLGSNFIFSSRGNSG